jgi:ribonuclease HI
MRYPVVNVYILAGSGADTPTGMFVLEDDASKQTKAYKRTFLEPMTKNRLSLSLVLAALNRLTTRCEVHLYTDSLHVESAFSNGWLNDWRQQAWKNAKGKPVANADLWKEVYGYMGKHVLSVQFSNSNSMYAWMKEQMKNVADR